MFEWERSHSAIQTCLALLSCILFHYHNYIYHHVSDITDMTFVSATSIVDAPTRRHVTRLNCYSHPHWMYPVVVCVCLAGADIVNRVKKTEHPPFRPTVLAYKEQLFAPEYYQLMEQCWSEKPSQRPDFAKILNTLRTFSILRSHIYSCFLNE